MSTVASRRWAADAARKRGRGLTMDPDADGPGVRGWLEGAGSLGSLGGQNTLAVAFDTRLSGVPLFTGRASRGISRLLAGHGCRMFAAPESFLVSKKDTLRDGEAARARAWGAMIGAAASDLYAPAAEGSGRSPAVRPCWPAARRQKLTDGRGGFPGPSYAA